MVEGASPAQDMRRSYHQPRPGDEGADPNKPIFRRQHAFESLIFDFYCSAAKLAVEDWETTHFPGEFFPGSSGHAWFNPEARC